MILGQLGDSSRVPFERPVQASSGFVPRSLDTGFVAAENLPFPQVMAARLARLPAGVQQPLAAEPGTLPAAQPVDSGTPPSATGIVKAKRARMLPIPLLMTVGMFSPPRGGVRAGLNPSKVVAAGRKPSV